MNLLTRGKMSSRLILSSSSPSRRLFDLHPQTPYLQRSDFYYTKAGTRRPKIPKTTGPPSSTFCQRNRKQTEALTDVWPKPGDMPYQEKVANFVNLIGRVEFPVRFHCSLDRKYFATAVISLADGAQRKSPMVPVVFEGDLAHIVSCYVKENDYVFVSGQLSVGPTRLVSSDSLGKFHVVGENVSFVEGFKKNEAKVFDEMSERADDENGDKKMLDEMPKRADDKNGGKKMFDEMPDRDDDKNGDKKMFDEMPKIADHKNGDKKLLDEMHERASAPLAAHVERGGVFKSKLEKGDGNKKKDDENLWRDLVRNPLQWWDYRNHKSNGLVKEKFPDFKQKVTGEALWISDAPKWLLLGIGKLEFDVKNIKPKQVVGAMVDDSWKDLVENPNKWWDNRIKKKNPKQPDFKHKETDAVLWLNRSPAWVLSKLPPMRN